MKSEPRSGAWALLFCLGLGWAAVSAAAVEDDPVLWPDRERSFWMEGPRLLLSEAEQEELRDSPAEDRSRWVGEFLEADPFPETPSNELVDAIDRRRRLVFSEFNTFLDDRARFLFLYGEPVERRKVECGQTFQPLEIWTYPESVSRHRLLFYRRGTDGPYRLWIPLDSKRVLYNKDMEYWLLQFEELRRYIRGKRFDIQACDEALLIDEVTGIAGLRGYTEGRPTNDELLDLLEPPADRAEWARTAASTVLPEPAAELELGAVDLLFPERRGQRTVVRTLLTIPIDTKLGLAPGDDDGPEQHKLTIEGSVEQDGSLFETYRVRFKLQPPAREVPIALAVERALRADRAYLMRFKVIDEVTGAQVHVARGALVPTETEAVETPLTQDLLVVEMEKDLASAVIAGKDSLLLAPPDGRLALGIWRADALVSGTRIVEVVFSVDGVSQMRRTKPPFSAELRLSEFPTEQVVSAVGLDANGEVVASDEVVLNQPRGAFSVRILSPEANQEVEGVVDARAAVTVPDERRIERVEFLLNDELVASLEDDPWHASIEVPDPATAETAYLTVVATLDNGARAEAVRFLNAPEFVESLGVNLVEMLVTVLDKDRRPVPGLSVDDFQVREDGRPQAIDRFERVEDLPLSIGITIDTSSSMASALPEAQKAAIGFLDDVINTQDRAFLVAFAREATLMVPPTDDLAAIEEALENLQSLGWTALHDAVVTSLYYFRGFRGRRALVLLSDGDDSASQYAFRDALEYARRSGVVIYTVGLDVGVTKTGIRGKLNQLASETGGRTFFIKEAAELAGVYEEIEEELRSQYFVAYSSNNPSADEAFRAIELKVKDGKLSPRALRGYYPN